MFSPSFLRRVEDVVVGWCVSGAAAIRVERRNPKQRSVNFVR